MKGMNQAGFVLALVSTAYGHGLLNALWVSSVKCFSPAFKSQQVYRQVVSSLKVIEEVSAFLYDTSGHSICEVPAGLLCFTWVA